MDSLETIHQNTSLEKIEELSATDVLRHFNKNIYPGIKAKYFSVPAKAKRSIKSLFSKKKEESHAEKYDETIDKLFRTEVAKGIFDLVIGDLIISLKKKEYNSYHCLGFSGAGDFIRIGSGDSNCVLFVAEDY